MRDKDIKANLEYAKAKQKELSNLLFESRMKEQPINHIANLAADVLSNVTECFDYCAKDIYERYLSDKLNPKEKKGLKVYFPFYENQNFLTLLQKYKKPVYNFLLETIKKADKNEAIPNSLSRYSIAREVRSLVNNKKHDKVIEVNIQGSPDLLVESEHEIKMWMSIEEQQIPPGQGIEILPGANKKAKIVPSYRLKENNQEVSGFCGSAIGNAEYILDAVYRKFLGSKIK